LVLCKSKRLNLQQKNKKSSKRYVNAKDLFAKDLMVEKPWFVHVVNFDLEAG
jgi:hypothetical protein